MKKIAILLILVIPACFPNLSLSQVAPEKYFIEFMNKTNSPYSVTRPQEFLSARAIERRQKQGIPVEENDLPVNLTYINGVRKFTNSILTRSKWFNGITIYCLNPALVDSISRLPYVKRVIKNSNKNSLLYDSLSIDKFKLEESLLEYKIDSEISTSIGYNVNTKYDYGPSFRQIHMVNGDSLHDIGYRGQGMVIAILDGGFSGADHLKAFDSLWSNNQILGTKDFVTPGNSVFNGSAHGMEVLSCIGGNIPGQLIGTAPKANFWLLHTEDVGSEYLIEEYNWVAGAEFADSAGADIINSSLGYTEFNDTSTNHSCSDMNGNTTPATVGANLAVKKGMIVVNSAGNSGGSSWKCVSSPADGFNVLAVAAVDSNGIRASFSSVGEATRRIKPNVAAMGSFVVVSSSVGSIMRASGTSFSSPIIAGMVACLWQALPGWNNYLISRSIELSGNKVNNPDSLTGYGIPDFVKAMKIVSVSENDRGVSLKVYPNPFTTKLSLTLTSVREQEVYVSIFDQQARKISLFEKIKVSSGESVIHIDNLNDLKNGIYLLNISGSDISYNTKIIKINN